MTINNSDCMPSAMGSKGMTDIISTHLESLARDVFPELFAQAVSGGTPFEEPEGEISILPISAYLEEQEPAKAEQACGCAPACGNTLDENAVPSSLLSSLQIFSLWDPLALRIPNGFDVHTVRKDFPILSERINGKPLIWLDNAATTQKPKAVIDRIRHFYEHENSNVHRGAHALAAKTTEAFESARKKAARFINAKSAEQIVFVRGTTEAINLVAHSYGTHALKAGDEILLSTLEHHANIVPWQLLCERTGASVRVIPVNEGGQVDMQAYSDLLSARTKIVAFTHVSNVLGTVLPAAEMTELAHRKGSVVLIDGAQAVAHMPVDVQAIGCDFYAFSGHKLYGPTGIGVLYGKAEILESMSPYQGGGNMIREVHFEGTTYQPPPHRFEAGTANIADAIGLGAAIDYVSSLGIQAISAHEHELWEYGWEALSDIPAVRLYGDRKDKIGVLSFTCEGLPAQQLAQELDGEGIAVRAGHHCAQPILRRFGITGTVRASFALYNTKQEIDRLGEQLARACYRFL